MANFLLKKFIETNIFFEFPENHYDIMTDGGNQSTWKKKQNP
jgi:hypothetical protein